MFLFRFLLLFVFWQFVCWGFLFVCLFWGFFPPFFVLRSWVIFFIPGFLSLSGLWYVPAEWGKQLGNYELRLRTVLKYQLSLFVLWSCISCYSGECDVRAIDAVLAAVRKQCIPQLLCLLRVFLSWEEMEVVTGVLTTHLINV